MKYEAIITKEGKFWMIECEALDILTQSSTKGAAAETLKDSIESYINKENFNVTVTLREKNKLIVSTNNQTEMIALMLKRQRQKHGVTMKQITENMGASSITAYARYEQGKSCPTIEKLEQIMTAISNEIVFGLAI